MSIRVMTAVWDSAEVQGSELLVLLALADWADDVGICWPAMSTLAGKARISERSAQRACRSLAEKGLLEINDNAGPKGANRYRIVTDRAPQPDTTSSGGGDNLTPHDAPKWGDTGDTPGVTPVTPGGDTGVTRTVIEPSDNRQEREGAGAPADGGRKGTQDVDRPAASDEPADSGSPLSTEQPGEELTGRGKHDTPGTADFAKRVQRLCAGTGYLTGRWPDWDQVTIGYLEKQFAALSSEERLEMERWRDPVLSDFEARKRKPPPLGPFMAHRQWQALEPAILERFEKIKAARLPAAERPKPDGWAACMGPVGMAWLFDKLLAGPAEDPGDQPLFVASVLQRCWPAVAEWQQVQQQRGGLAFGQRWHDLKDSMEPVPPGEMLDAWRAEFGARRWPWPSAFDRADVVYCPKGGPDGLDRFSEAVRQAAGDATQEAAE